MFCVWVSANIRVHCFSVPLWVLELFHCLWTVGRLGPRQCCTISPLLVLAVVHAWILFIQTALLFVFFCMHSFLIFDCAGYIVYFRFSAATNNSDTNTTSASSTDINSSSAPGQTHSPKPGTPISSSLTELTPVQPSLSQAYTPLPSFPAQFSSKKIQICQINFEISAVWK